MENVPPTWLIHKTWKRFRYATHDPCDVCGHDKYHHLGAREPGCTYLGTCECPSYERNAA